MTASVTLILDLLGDPKMHALVLQVFGVAVLITLYIYTGPVPY